MEETISSAEDIFHPMPAAPDHVGRIMAAWARERPDLDVEPQGVIGRLHRIAAALDVELATVYRKHGLGDGEFDVLATLRRAGAPFTLSAGELTDQMMITSGATTKRVDRLELAGLVVRKVSRSDGRRRVVALTPAGRRTIDAAFTEHIANEHRLVGVLTAAERRQLARLLETWAGAFEDAPG
jgi:DNA-binding MarR family transcriptional regulator